jgi:hypothetical protein
MIGDILFENAFPDGDEWNQMSRDTVMYAGKELKHENLVNRLKNDIDYLEQLAKVVRHSSPCDNGDCYDPCIGRKSHQSDLSHHQEVHRRTRCCQVWAERKWRQGDISLAWEGLYLSVQGRQGTTGLIL